MQALEVSLGLQRLGHHVTLAAPPGSRLAEEAAAHQLPTLLLDISGYLHPILVWRLRNALLSTAADVVHCQHSRDLATVVPALRLAGTGIPLVLSKRMGSYISKKDLFHRYTHRRISRVLAISEIIRTNVIDTTPVLPERVSTLHDAVDTSVFSPDRTDRWRVRRDAGIPDDALVVGFVGRFSPGKGIEEILLSAARLRDSYPTVRYLLAGDAGQGEEPYGVSLRQMALELSLTDIVKFIGHRTDIPAVMASFDILAFPSYAEAFGVVLIEAMAMQLPVVSTNCDGVIDIVVNGVTGVSVPPRDAQAFALGLETLIRDGELRQRMGSAGRTRVLENFDRVRQLRKLEEIYKEVIVNCQLPVDN